MVSEGFKEDILEQILRKSKKCLSGKMKSSRQRIHKKNMFSKPRLEIAQCMLGKFWSMRYRWSGYMRLTEELQ